MEQRPTDAELAANRLSSTETDAQLGELLFSELTGSNRGRRAGTAHSALWWPCGGCSQLLRYTISVELVDQQGVPVVRNTTVTVPEHRCSWHPVGG